MNQLETLLQRYKEGVITPDEQAELDRLTNRHQVFSAASAQASAMRRRRYAVVSSVASLLIVAGNTQCSPDSVINDIWNFLKA